MVHLHFDSCFPCESGLTPTPMVFFLHFSKKSFLAICVIWHSFPGGFSSGRSKWDDCNVMYHELVTNSIALCLKAVWAEFIITVACSQFLDRIAVLLTYMRPIVTDRVAWSHWSVGRFRSRALQKWLKRSRCLLGYGLGCAQGSIFRGLHVVSTWRIRIHVWWQCGLLSNYFDHLLLSLLSA